MPQVKIDIQRCKGCFLCVSFCPRNLIKPTNKINEKGLNFVEFDGSKEKCIGCGFCAVICPDACIEIY